MKKYIRPVIINILWFFIITALAYADGMIVIPEWPHPRQPSVRNAFPLDVKYHHVDVDINDQTAVTSVDQIFYNPTGSRLEGYYLFPVPKNTVIKKFSMYIDGRETEAELLPAEKARKIYNDIVQKQLDPALLEYYEYDLFRVKIFPIEPYSDKKVKIKYYEILNKDNKTIEYVYPLNTEKFSRSLLQDVRIKVNIKSRSKLKNLYCVSHKTDIIRKDACEAVVSYEEENIRPDKNFILYFSTENSSLGLSLLTAKEEEDNTQYFLLDISPDWKRSADNISKKDITFVLDVSGSMTGEKLKQAKNALLFCIEHLNPQDKFNIIRFSTEAEALFQTRMPAETEYINKAKSFIKELKAIGGTNIEEALTLALAEKDKDQIPHIIIFMTDGKPMIGETDEIALISVIKKANFQKTRIFTFGIGEEINTHLLDQITEITKAYRSYISPEEDIEIKISQFYQKIESPVLTDIQIQFPDSIKIFQTYPKELPDLFLGSSITLLGKFKGEGSGKITVEGYLNRKKQSFPFDLSFSTGKNNNEFIPALWAARRIGYLLDQIRLHGEDKELIDEITQLARKYGVITPYTSYLILEDEQQKVSRREIETDDQTLGNILPSGSPLREENKKEYYSLYDKSGQSSITASKEAQELNQAENYSHLLQGKKRMKYVNSEQKEQNLTQQVKNIQGRAFYNSNNLWIDSRLQDNKNKKTTKIKFSSPDYYRFLKKYPQQASLLSLGKNIRFVMDNEIYEIHE